MSGGKTGGDGDPEKFGFFCVNNKSAINYFFYFDIFY